MHGLVTFHLKGQGVRKVRWFVDTRSAGKSAKKWEWVNNHGRAYHIYLWASSAGASTCGAATPSRRASR